MEDSHSKRFDQNDDQNKDRNVDELRRQLAARGIDFDEAYRVIKKAFTNPKPIDLSGRIAP